MKELKLGTRGSPLAMVQANMVKDALSKIAPDTHVEILKILTSGDWKPSDGETKLSEEAGGKGLFAKEIEQRLIDGSIDIAVHSMKDMESFLPEGLIIPWMLPREDPKDALICSNLSNNVQKIDDLLIGCVIGTSSVRRAAFLLSKRPDLKIEPLRGNVKTRLDKLKDGQVDATLLAVAGLNRLGMSDEITCALDMDDMLPAAAQGAVGIEICASRIDELSFIGQISCLETVICVSAEREVLRVLDGSCHTPIAAHAVLDNGTMHLRGAICSFDGQQIFTAEASMAVTDIKSAAAIGTIVGVDLKSQAPADLFS